MTPSRDSGVGSFRKASCSSRLGGKPIKSRKRGAVIDEGVPAARVADRGLRASQRRKRQSGCVRGGLQRRRSTPVEKAACAAGKPSGRAPGRTSRAPNPRRGPRRPRATGLPRQSIGGFARPARRSNAVRPEADELLVETGDVSIKYAAGAVTGNDRGTPDPPPRKACSRLSSRNSLWWVSALWQTWQRASKIGRMSRSKSTVSAVAATGQKTAANRKACPALSITSTIAPNPKRVVSATRDSPILAVRHVRATPVLKDSEGRWVDCCRRQLVKRYNLDDVMGGPPSYSLETF